MFCSRGYILFLFLLRGLIGGVIESVYYVALSCLLLSFLLIRFPYIFGVLGFSVFLITMIMPLFLGLMWVRLHDSFSLFFSSFIPLGTPLWIAPFVCLAETISYMVRPIVLIIRPFLNLSIGAIGGFSLGSMCLKYSYMISLVLIVLFLYEIFVALVHWFIVCNILSFSKDD